MTAIRINHVSVHGDDLEASAQFYEELFGLERVPTPRFQEDVVWLKLGDQQLHIFKREDAVPPKLHHLGIDVDDFEAVYWKTKERGLLDGETWHQAIRRHPLGWVQMYIRDPAGNLVEINWPDMSSLSPELQGEIGRLEDEMEQTDTAEAATLYT
jgi:lactoylglutathione lyase